jgi:hypothetical protein
MRRAREDNPQGVTMSSGAGANLAWKSSEGFGSYDDALDEFFQTFRRIPPQRPQGAVCKKDREDDCETLIFLL